MKVSRAVSFHLQYHQANSKKTPANPVSSFSPNFLAPILLGGGTSLFGELQSYLFFEHVGTEVLLNAIVKSHYTRIR